MPIDFTFLADRMDAIPIISKWYFDKWGHRPLLAGYIYSNNVSGSFRFRGPLGDQFQLGFLILIKASRLLVVVYYLDIF